MKNFLKIFEKSSKVTKQDKSLKEALKERYLTFQNLLAKNNHVLELMADMEEKLSGEFLFDRNYINQNTMTITRGIKDIIEHLNIISKDKYSALYERFNYIVSNIENLVASKREIPFSSLTIPFNDITMEMIDRLGGKSANLGELKNHLNIPTPDGFAISAYAFKRFMEHNGFIEKINERLLALSVENMEKLNQVSREIQEMVIGAEIPDDLQNAIKKSVEKLKVAQLNVQPFNLSTFQLSTVQPFNFSVRSSAIHEDGEFSFAGQYSTFLNVSEDLILRRYKEVVASLFTPRAIFYYKTKGFLEEEMVMSVGVLKMIDAKAGGVIYTRDPNNPESDYIIINAVHGLGKYVVDGTVTPDSYKVSRHPAGTIIDKKISNQETMLICKHDGTIEETAIPEELIVKQCLTDEQIKVLAGYALALEKHYGSPQDIEWAISSDNHLYILQTRPLRMLKVESEKLKVPRRIEKYNILLDRGVIACKGIGAGRAFVLKDEEDLKDFPEGAVLVARHTSTKFVTVMNKASAIITDVGSSTGHMASLSKEYNIPTILDTEVATSVIKDGQEITVDAINCNIYDGKVDELLEYALKKKEPFKDTHLFRTLEKVLKWIVPLNLVDPEDKTFKPEYCRTFHDITRFAHEMAMAERI